MYLTSPDQLVPATHEVNNNNNTSQEQQINIPSTQGRPHVSELPSRRTSIDDHNTLSQLQEHEIINILDTSPGITDDLGNEIESDGAVTTSKPSPYRGPCRDLLCGSNEDYMKICFPLYEAAVTGNWKAAKVILDERPELVRFAITTNGDTLLHVVAAAEPTEAVENFVENLVSRMKVTDLEIQNDAGDYTFQVVVLKGSVKMFEVMMNKHKKLLNILDPRNIWTGLEASTQYKHGSMDYKFLSLQRLGF